ncbi:MAG: hypothetical protein QNL62_08755 [Gammaproteobacteria bacterium]|nr:hypothetical protein [Gammaproteobacteria bacterium]
MNKTFEPIFTFLKDTGNIVNNKVAIAGGCGAGIQVLSIYLI